MPAKIFKMAAKTEIFFKNLKIGQNALKIGLKWFSAKWQPF